MNLDAYQKQLQREEAKLLSFWQGPLADFANVREKAPKLHLGLLYDMMRGAYDFAKLRYDELKAELEQRKAQYAGLSIEQRLQVELLLFESFLDSPSLRLQQALKAGRTAWLQRIAEGVPVSPETLEVIQEVFSGALRACHADVQAPAEKKDKGSSWITKLAFVGGAFWLGKSQSDKEKAQPQIRRKRRRAA